MADITRANVSLATLNPPPGCQLTREAAVDITAGDMVYLTSANKFDQADGSAADALALRWGMALRSAKAGSPVAAIHSVEMNYATGMTPGARLYLSANAGALADAGTTGDAGGSAIVTGTTTVYVLAPSK